MGVSEEPVSYAGAITALAVAAIPLLRAFNVSISEDQANASLAFLAALIVIITLAVRSQVTPVDKANEKIEQAYNTEAGSGKPIPRV